MQIMGKPFNNELMLLKSTVEWADRQDVSRLTTFLFQQERERPLACIGSGGSLSACHYAALLCKRRNGVISTAMTPLELMYSGREVIRKSKLFYLSASGKNNDIINAIKYGVKYNEAMMMSLSLRKNNPTEQLLERYPKVLRWCEEIPSGKDGFLATNSLLATFALLCRSYDSVPVSDVLHFDESYRMSRDTNLADTENFIVLYGAAGESVAKDIESKLTEAALGAALLSDYRNFGHGRHHWFAKRKANSCIIALVTPIEKELAMKTINCLPADIPVMYIESELNFPKASVEMLIKAFRFVQDLGKARGIDPGRPGVPSYGRTLYNLNYFKLTNDILPSESTQDAAVKRKLGIARYENAKLREYYRNAYKKFIRRLNKSCFTTIVFDYDGTLSSPDHVSRYTEELCDEMKTALENLLRNGVEIRVATGRGWSVRKVFRNSINDAYWPQVKIGYYNGACLCELYEDKKLDMWKRQPLNTELRTLEETLRKRLPRDCVNYELMERNQQLSVENVATEADSEIIYATCCEIIWDKQLTGIHVWRSSHSMDVVVYSKANKLKVVEDKEHTLCIGDYGCLDGNDYELLTCNASLSVDRVSHNADCCWNIVPSGIRGIEATLYYLSHLSVKNGKIKCSFSI